MIPRHISFSPLDAVVFNGDIFTRGDLQRTRARLPRCNCATSLDWIQFAESFVGFSIRAVLECA